MTKKVIYPGTFDPVTNGHLDIIRRAAKIFPEVLVGVAINKNKQPYFSLADRITLLTDATANLPQVFIKSFDCLLSDFAAQENTNIILRGLRAVSDFEYEFQLAGMNRKLSAELETIFLTPSEEFMFISSTLVREIATLKGDIKKFVPKNVAKALEASR